ncbi:MAG: DUF4922 domain-containing protein [Acidobacteria bacterium]|nr:DUF4922 domain-containing protein [Acidobacteriota bacterium]
MKSALEDLFESQIRTWALLARGVDGLAHAATRQVRIDWFDVFIRHIPHRIASTTAAVDPAAVQTRPCFICPANLPREEKGLQYGDFTLYCNPFPILERHLTIVHREHRPQLIAGQIGSMLELAKALPGYFVVYNGPQCGASAPDHMHFQACSRRLFPIEKDAAARTGIVIPKYRRNVLVYQDSAEASLIRRIEEAIAAIDSVSSGRSPEPMINIAAFCDSGIWTVYVFPRSRHRPAVFHSGELTVSPASIDLCGVFVVPLEKDFQRITASDVAKIYKEVTLPDSKFKRVLEQLL